MLLKKCCQCTYCQSPHREDCAVPDSKLLQACLFLIISKSTFILMQQRKLKYAWQEISSAAQCFIFTRTSRYAMKIRIITYVIKTRVNGFLGVMGQWRGGNKNLNSSPTSPEVVVTRILIGWMFVKPLTSSVPPALFHMGNLLLLSSLQDFSSSVFSNQIMVIFKWLPFYSEIFIFSCISPLRKMLA